MHYSQVKNNKNKTGGESGRMRRPVKKEKTGGESGTMRRPVTNNNKLKRLDWSPTPYGPTEILKHDLNTICII